MRYFVTSDHHFGHQAIIGYSGRPFKSVEDMDARLIKNWNERVKPGDMVFHLGDFQFKNSPGGNQEQGRPMSDKRHYWNQLNGHIVHVRGNHDINNGLKSIIENVTISYGGFRISMCHDPSDFVEPTEYNPIHFWICGHVHQNWAHDWRGHMGHRLIINAGVDVHKFYPVTLDEIIKIRNRLVKQRQHGAMVLGQADPNDPDKAGGR